MVANPGVGVPSSGDCVRLGGARGVDAALPEAGEEEGSHFLPLASTMSSPPSRKASGCEEVSVAEPRGDARET